MTSKERKTQGYSIGGGGSVFTDRLYCELPNLKGYEISEEEALEFEAQVASQKCAQ